MTNKSKPAPSADEIAEIATRGGDVSKFFTNEFTVVRLSVGVSDDPTQRMLQELNGDATRSNVNRKPDVKIS